MRGTACTGDDDFDAAFFSVGSVLEKQVGRAMRGDNARFMGNTELAERFGGVLHGVPIRARAHDDGDEGVSDMSLPVARRPVAFCLHYICQTFQSVAALAGAPHPAPLQNPGPRTTNAGQTAGAIKSRYTLRGIFFRFLPRSPLCPRSFHYSPHLHLIHPN